AFQHRQSLREFCCSLLPLLFSHSDFCQHALPQGQVGTLSRLHGQLAQALGLLACRRPGALLQPILTQSVTQWHLENPLHGLRLMLELLEDRVETVPSTLGVPESMVGTSE